MTRKSTLLFALRTLALLLAFITDFALTKLLEKDAYGFFASCISLSIILSTIGSLGLPNVLLRHLPAYLAKDNFSLSLGLIKWTGNRVLIFSSLTCLIALVAFSANELTPQYLLGDRYQHFSFFIILLTIPVLSANLFKQSALIAIKKPVLSQLGLPLIKPIVFLSLAFSWALIQPGFSVASASICLIVSLLVTLLANSLWCKRAMKSVFATREILFAQNDWLASCYPLAWIALLSTLLGSTDAWFLATYSTKESAADYNIAWKIALVIPFGLSIVNIVLAPFFSELYELKNGAKLQSLLTKCSRLILLYSLPIAALLALFSPWYLGYLGQIPGQYLTAQTTLNLLILGQLANTLVGPVGYLLLMTGHQSISAKLLTIVVLIKLALNFSLIPTYQAEGAAISTVFSMAILNISQYVAVKKILRLEPSALPPRNPTTL